MDTYVRLSEIEIKNIKNVEYGTISFTDKQDFSNPSVLGIYGQNGSGKTTVIDAIQILDYLLNGVQIPDEYVGLININTQNASIKYCFDIKGQDSFCGVQYEVFFKRELKQTDDYGEDVINDEEESLYKLLVYNETIRYSFSNSETKHKLNLLIDTNTTNNEVFGPSTKYSLLFGDNSDTFMSLMVAKKIANLNSKSFVFSSDFFKVLRDRAKTETNLEFIRVYDLLERLSSYGKQELFVISTTNAGLISLGALPLYSTSVKGINPNLLPINKAINIPHSVFDSVKTNIANINIVLEQIVPNLQLAIKNYGEQINSKGDTVNKIELVSLKNGKEIPLRYESEGIKKIISILQLLIGVYNRPSFTVAIDELDSGIFEYLLGEIVKIIAEQGKGQLIFTSHNLRPLETLHKKCIAFSTTNPSNRYIRMANVKKNNNLRDFYYRDILLGTQKEVLYDSANCGKIALAFRKAGISNGT